MQIRALFPRRAVRAEEVEGEAPYRKAAESLDGPDDVIVPLPVGAAEPQIEDAAGEDEVRRRQLVLGGRERRAIDVAMVAGRFMDHPGGEIETCVGAGVTSCTEPPQQIAR